MTETTVQFLWLDRSIHSGFRAGVSLHSHTMYSEESLGMIPRYVGRLPLLGPAVRAESEKYHRWKCEPLDFSRAFWTPPLSAREAYQLEQNQIQRTLELPAIVSLTDHDDIRAGAQLRILDDSLEIPVSAEWTIPFGSTFFHLGVHNLPAQQASGIMQRLQRYTADPEPGELEGLLEWLDSMPDVLVVLNHPLWDEKGIGVSEHAHVLGRLLERHGRYFHALEVNGLRSWKENQKVLWLGRQSNHPVVSGGDRHGSEPNAILNLSRGANWIDFVREVRCERRSHVVFMPQYREPLRMRILQTMVDIVRDYPENLEGRKSWSDRVYYRQTDGPPVPLRHYWPSGKPFVIQAFVRAMRIAELRSVQSAIRLALSDRTLWSDQEALI
ncbi:MAG: hypothetical protein WAM39_05155 [Bryobacteraceae bacterium]